jgi:arginase
MYHRHPVEVVGVPFGLGGSRPGASLGPDAIRFANLIAELGRLAEVTDAGNIASRPIGVPAAATHGIRNFEPTLHNIIQVRDRLSDTLARGFVPVVLGGDHSLSIGTLSAAVAHDPDVAVLWIDAHADLNTPDTSPSMNLHGMTLGALMRYSCEHGATEARAQWDRVLDEVVPQPGIQPGRVIWFGLRDLDDGERQRLIEGDLRRAITMYEVDHFGLEAMMEHAAGYLERAGVSRLWVSLDVDVLDPLIAPGTGTGVRGGFNYREMHLLAEFLYELIGRDTSPFELAGVDVVEVNPPLDRQNETARLATEWLCSLFGKRILPRWA